MFTAACVVVASWVRLEPPGAFLGVSQRDGRLRVSWGFVGPLEAALGPSWAILDSKPRRCRRYNIWSLGVTHVIIFKAAALLTL